MLDTLNKFNSYAEVLDAFSEEVGQAKRFEIACEHRFSVSLTDFYLDPVERKVDGFNGADSESLLTCYKDGSFNQASLKDILASTYKNNSRAQIVEILSKYKLEAAQKISKNFSSVSV
jgi:hypothetical protein